MLLDWTFGAKSMPKFIFLGILTGWHTITRKRTRDNEAGGPSSQNTDSPRSTTDKAVTEDGK